MVMRRRSGERRHALFVTADALPKSSGHPFYRKLYALLSETEFDRWIERRCERYHAIEDERARPSTPPGADFYALLIGYFEEIDSHNLAHLLRKLFGIGKPRPLQGERGLGALVPIAVAALLTLVGAAERQRLGGAAAGQAPHAA